MKRTPSGARRWLPWVGGVLGMLAVAIGVVLEPAQYLFLVVFLGFLMILGHFMRFIGSSVVGGVFALSLFGVAPEPALAMVLIVEMANILSIASVGAISLWAQGVALQDLRAAKAKPNHKTLR